MQKVMLLQLGTGGMAWLLFTAGLLWCGFSWWRATRCRSALACVLAAITSVVCGLLVIALGLFQSYFFGTTGADDKLLEQIALVLLVLAGAGWAASSLCFLVAAGRSTYPRPEEFQTQPHHPPQE